MLIEVLNESNDVVSSKEVTVEIPDTVGPDDDVITGENLSEGQRYSVKQIAGKDNIDHKGDWGVYDSKTKKYVVKCESEEEALEIAKDLNS